MYISLTSIRRIMHLFYKLDIYFHTAGNQAKGTEGEHFLLYTLNYRPLHQACARNK